MTTLNYILLFSAGIGAGIINTVAGGGSVLTLPALIFCGIPPGAANATNRIGVIAQNITAIRQFRNNGISEWPLTWRLMLVGVFGSVLGAQLATYIPDAKFEKLLGVLMLGLLPLTLIKPRKAPQPSSISTASDAAVNETLNPSRDYWAPLTPRMQWVSLVTFFALGIYGGFLQAGIGIMILIASDHLLRVGLKNANYLKLVFILAVTVWAFALFVIKGVNIAWIAGVVVTCGQIIGAWMGSWVAIKKGEKLIRAFMVVSILLSSAKLLGFFG